MGVHCGGAAVTTQKMFSIEKNIPIPPKKMNKNAMYPFRLMEVGDSFSVPIASYNKDEQSKTYRMIYNMRYRYKPKKFAIRIDDNSIRCWRTE